MLQSKLSKDYPVADPKEHLYGADHTLIDPTLAGRLAFVAKKTGVKIKLTEGYRSTEYQAELYAKYLEFKRTGKGLIKLAAKPGTSWHEFRLAVDTSTQPIRGMSNIELRQFGLCKPISSEPWHIQPIETLNQTDRKKYEPLEVEDLTREETRALIIEVVNEIVFPRGGKPSDWAEKAWEEAKAKGITDGSNPKAVVTREQCIAIVDRAINGGA